MITPKRRHVRMLRDVQESVDEAFAVVPLSTIKDYLVVEHDDDTALLDRLLATAQRHFELRTSHYVNEQTRVAYFDGPATANTIRITEGGTSSDSGWRLPAMPFRSLAGVETLDEGEATDEGVDNFYVREGTPPRVLPKRGTVLSSPYQQVKITYVVGYASADAVPEDLKTILAKMVSDLYEFRTSVHQEGSLPRELPMRWVDLIRPYKTIYL